MNTGKRTVLRWLVVALGCAMLFAGTHTARAAALIFEDASPSDNMITVRANDFEFGLTVNGNPFQSGLGNPASTTVPDTTIVNFAGSWIDLGASTPLSRTIYIVDLADPTRVRASLAYTVSTDGFAGTITGTFRSDTVGDLGPLPGGVDPADIFAENGQTVPFGAAFLGGEIHTETGCVTDTQTPVVRLITPAYDMTGLPPVTIPIDIRFTSSDDCRVTHEVLKLSGCTIVDGNVVGDRDGLLSDEGIQLNKPKLCQFMSQCGFLTLQNPTVRVEATDPAGHVGYDQHIIRKYLLRTEVCSRP